MAELTAPASAADAWPLDPQEATRQALRPSAHGPDRLVGLLQAADAGFAPAQYELGLALIAANGARDAVVGRFQTLPAPTSAADDTALGRKLIARAARRWPPAAGWIALYRTPIPGTKDERPAAQVLRGLAALARPEPDRLEALRQLGLAARQRDAEGCFWLAMVLADTHDVTGPVAADAARQALTAAAESGHLEAMTALGLALVGESHHPGALEVGLNWLQRAADAGDPWAQFQLGLLYHRGVEVPWQPILALRWLGQAAESGNLQAEAMARALAPLAVVAEGQDGEGAWFGYACEAGEWESPGALAVMARCLETGNGAPRNKSLALDLWMRAARGQEPQAVKRLARLAARGALAGTPQGQADGAPASQLLRPAAEALVATAASAFVFWDEDTAGAPALAVAIAQTVRALRTLAGSNDDAAFQLAYLAWHGIGMPHDPAHADGLLAGPVRRRHPGACGLAALIATDLADLARLAHFEHGGADPEPGQRKAEQAMALAAELATPAGRTDTPTILPAHVAAPWRLAHERLKALGEVGLQTGLEAPRLYAGRDDEADDWRLCVSGEADAAQYTGDDAAECVPDIVAVARYGAVAAPTLASGIRALGAPERAAVGRLACLQVAAAMGRPAAGERARERALELGFEQVALARALATAWWRWREEAGDFAELRFAGAWERARTS